MEKNTKQHDSKSSGMIIDASKNTETTRNTELHPQTDPDLPSTEDTNTPATFYTPVDTRNPFLILEDEKTELRLDIVK